MAKKNENDGVEFGSFRRESDGAEVVATSLEEAVHYRFEGWQETAPPAAENVPPAAAAE